MKLLLTRKIAAVAIACLLAANSFAGTASWNAGNGDWDSVSWSTGAAGDFDGDGDVDGADFIKWQQDGLGAPALADWNSGYGSTGGGANVNSLTAFGSVERLSDDDVATIDNGSTVIGNTNGGSVDDSRFLNGSVLNISGGSTLELSSLNTDVDGLWNIADGTLNLDNGTLDRSQISGTSLMGGFFMLGSWSSSVSDPIRMNLDNGSTFLNNGTVTFGIDSDSPVGIDAKMTIGGGSTVDLTGGDGLGAGGLDNNGVGVAGIRDLSFVYGFDTGGGDGPNTHVVDVVGGGNTVVVDNGIQIATEDLLGNWTLQNDVSYEDLWNAGILKSNGSNSGTFGEHFTVTGTPSGADYTLTSRTATVWTGGNADWDAAGAWSGVNSLTAFGSVERLSDDDVATINDGSTVVGNTNGGSVDDSRFLKGSVLNISGGSTLELSSLNTDVDGLWNIADGTLNLDNGTLDRSQISGTSLMGGFFMLGSWSSDVNSPIRMNLQNGSTFTNNGTVTFGIDSDSPVGLDVKMTIAGGSLVDLTGGDGLGAGGLDNNGVGVAGIRDLSFVYGFDTGGGDGPNVHVIDMMDAGSQLIVDNGIQIATEDLLGNWTLQNDVSFEDLWNAGILQFEGGNAGTFASHFTVTGLPTDPNYTLTVSAGPLSAVPEPASALLLVLGGFALLGTRRNK